MKARAGIEFQKLDRVFFALCEMVKVQGEVFSGSSRS
jgi:hypothetical protein